MTSFVPAVLDTAPAKIIRRGAATTGRGLAMTFAKRLPLYRDGNSAKVLTDTPPPGASEGPLSLSLRWFEWRGVSARGGNPLPSRLARCKAGSGRRDLGCGGNAGSGRLAGTRQGTHDRLPRASSRPLCAYGGLVPSDYLSAGPQSGHHRAQRPAPIRRRQGARYSPGTTPLACMRFLVWSSHGFHGLTKNRRGSEISVGLNSGAARNFRRWCVGTRRDADGRGDESGACRGRGSAAGGA